MELPYAAYKEQNGDRPVRAKASSGIAGLRRKVRKKVKGEETLVTKIPEMGRKEASPRRHRGHGEDLGKGNRGLRG